MTTYSFYTAASHLKDFYDIVLRDDEFENIAMHAWDKIGNKVTRIYRHVLQVHDKQAELPCNVDILESVNSMYDDYQLTDNVIRENYSRNEVEVYIEGRRSNQNPLYQYGKLLNYTQVGNTIHFPQHHEQVMILYKGVQVDETGLPSLNYKEVEAIANYCAYVYYNKKGMMTKDQATMQIAQMLKQEWMRTCDDARTPIYLNQNEMDEILNVQTSWDRKRYGVSFKPLR